MTKQTLTFPSARLLSQLYCNKDENIRLVEKTLGVSITTREDWLTIEGPEDKVTQTAELFHTLELARSQGLVIKTSDFRHILSAVARGDIKDVQQIFHNPLSLEIHKKSIVPKTINQKRYLEYINKFDIVLCIGPAGTGKTYLAVAAALKAFLEDKVQRIILTRPAVEAGEALGFLPGDLEEKILPYLRPLYDAMYDMLGPEEANRLIEKDIIEIAPLAYMRGRTLSDAYVILDEAQNTTPEQMMMFLTRLGEGSRMIVTGDITQVDLPKNKTSGLRQAIKVLENVDKIKVFAFESKDVVRHPLVQEVIEAYEHFNSLSQ